LKNCVYCGNAARTTFHLEHVVTVAALRAAILDCTSSEEIVDVLGTLRLAWILKMEVAEPVELGVPARTTGPGRGVRAHRY
jgi:hypothetical protein